MSGRERLSDKDVAVLEELIVFCRRQIGLARATKQRILRRVSGSEGMSLHYSERETYARVSRSCSTKESRHRRWKNAATATTRSTRPPSTSLYLRIYGHYSLMDDRVAGSLGGVEWGASPLR